MIVGPDVVTRATPRYCAAMSTQPGWTLDTARCFASALVALLATAACGSGVAASQPPEPTGGAQPEPTPTVRIAEADSPAAADQREDQPETVTSTHLIEP